MKRLYFVFRGTQPAHAISKDVTALGFDEGQLHFLNKDHAGLDAQGVNQTNIFEEKDIGHSGFYGGIIGCIAGLLFTAFLASTSLGEYLNLVIGFFLIGLFTAFGTWTGGIVGISKDNHHIERFHDDIEHGETLLMIDAYDDRQEDKVITLMFTRHKEARYKGQDHNYSEFM